VGEARSACLVRSDRRGVAGLRRCVCGTELDELGVSETREAFAVHTSDRCRDAALRELEKIKALLARMYELWNWPKDDPSFTSARDVLFDEVEQIVGRRRHERTMRVWNGVMARQAGFND
jgi:hypothetical protein